MFERLKDRLCDDRGEAVLEFAIVMPIVLLAIVAAVAAGRLTGTESTVTDAAQAGARAASLARTPDEASAAGQEAAEATLPLGGVQCVSSSVNVDTSEWFEPGFVTVTVQCNVETGDLALIDGGPIDSIERSWVEAVDPARRTPEVLFE